MIDQDILKTMRQNVTAIETALKGDVSGYVHVWPEHWLGVKVNNDVCHATGVVNATVVSSRDRRIFRNGANQKAILMMREKALRSALAHAAALLEHFETMLKEIA